MSTKEQLSDTSEDLLVKMYVSKSQRIVIHMYQSTVFHRDAECVIMS